MQFGGKLALFAICWLLVAPTALAGTESDPDVDDHADKSSPSADLLSAWFEPHPNGIKFTVKIAGTPSPPKDHIYYVMFKLNGDTFLAGIAMDRDEHLTSYAGPNNLNGNGVKGPETFDSPLRQVRLERGTPAYATAIIPWGITANFEPGNALTDLTAGTALYGRQSGTWSDADFRVTRNTFVLEKALVPREVSQALPLILGLVGVALVSSVVTVLIVRKRLAGTSQPSTQASWAPPPTSPQSQSPPQPQSQTQSRSVPVEEAAAPRPRTPEATSKFTLRPPTDRKPPT